MEPQPEVEQFLVALALCHTVRITDNSSMANGSEESLEITIDNLNYQASSPDEKALVEACSRYSNRFIYHCNKKKFIFVWLPLSFIWRMIGDRSLL